MYTRKKLRTQRMKTYGPGAFKTKKSLSKDERKAQAAKRRKTQERLNELFVQVEKEGSGKKVRVTG